MNGFDAAVESIFKPIADILSAIVFVEVPLFGGIPIVVVWLMVAAIFYTVWLRFQPLTGVKHSLQVIKGRYAAKTDPGEVSSFQALATELSSTVGLGNISGVAIGIVIGGPGAALWIAMFGFFAMSVKMAEAALGARYRQVLDDGTTVGGAMYVLRDGFAEIGWKRTGIMMGAIYAVCALIGMVGGGNLFQANQVTLLITSGMGEESFLAQNQWVIGAVLAVMVGVVVLGGVTSIAKYTAKITPFMAIAYVIAAGTIIVLNIGQLPNAVAQIITGAFTADGVTGGVIGVAVAGIQRALFSNAAGAGTASMSFAATKNRDPAVEGYTAMWGPLVDSVIVCMLTATAIVITGVHEGGNADSDGVQLTAQAFASVSSWFPIVLTIMVFLFGFSTLLSYSFFAEMLATYLFGPTQRVRMTMRVVYVLLIVVGASISMDSMVKFADATTFLVTVPNLIGLYVLAKAVRRDILWHRTRVETGSLQALDPEVAVGLGDHEPTPEQVEQAEQEEAAEKKRLQTLHRELGQDPQWPHHDEHGRETEAGAR